MVWENCFEILSEFPAKGDWPEIEGAGEKICFFTALI
jgi:hypothetical protein